MRRERDKWIENNSSKTIFLSQMCQFEPDFVVIGLFEQGSDIFQLKELGISKTNRYPVFV